MNYSKLAIVFTAVLILFSNSVQAVASGSANAAGATQQYAHRDVVAILGVVAASTVDTWFTAPDIVFSNTDTVYLTIDVSGPTPAAGLLTTYTLTTFTDTPGSVCTIDAWAITTDTLAGSGMAASAKVHMNGQNHCQTFTTMQATIATVQIITMRFAADIRVQQTSLSVVNSGTTTHLEYQCAATLGTPNAFNPATNTCFTPQQLLIGCAATGLSVNTQTNTALCNTPITEQASLNYLCAATGGTPAAFNFAATVCNTPTMNTVLSGTLALTGTVTNPSCLTTNTCSFALSGTLNVVNSGGQNIAITSWPTLLATLSGGVTITDDANGWIIHQDPLSGTVNVVNSGTQHLIVDSWPTLNAALTGTINVNNNVQCTAIAPCHLVLDSASGTFNVVNSGSMTNTVTGNLNVHQDEACGAVVHCKVDMTCLAGTCQSAIDISNTTINNNSTSSNNLFLGIIPYNLLLFAIAFFAVAAESRGDVLYWVICLILSIVLLVVRPTDSIVPTPFFIGWIFVVLYQMIALLSNTRARNLGGESQEE